MFVRSVSRQSTTWAVRAARHRLMAAWHRPVLRHGSVARSSGRAALEQDPGSAVRNSAMVAPAQDGSAA